MIALLTVSSLFVGPLADEAAGHVAPWQTRGLYWDVAPADVEGHLFALKAEMQADPASAPTELNTNHASLSFSPAAGTAVQDLDALAVDTYGDAPYCGGGSPRFVLRIDEDGDGSRDNFLLAYLGDGPGFTGCATGTWVHHDLFAEPGARWFYPGLGYTDRATALAHLASAFPAHEVQRVDLQWDATWMFGATTVWFDNVAIDDHTFAEPVGPEVTCPVLPPEDPVVSVCPFRIT